MNRYLSSLHPAVIISDNVLVLHHGGVREHLVHRHLLVVAVVAQRFLADLDGVHDAVKTVAGFLHHAKLAGGDLAQLQKFQFVSKKEKYHQLPMRIKIFVQYWVRNGLITAGLEPVVSHNEKPSRYSIVLQTISYE